MPRDCPNIDCPMDATGHCTRCDGPKRYLLLTDEESQMFDIGADRQHRAPLRPASLKEPLVPKLTKLQARILQAAAIHPNGKTVADAPTGPLLAERGLLKHDRHNVYTITEAGRQAIVS